MAAPPVPTPELLAKLDIADATADMVASAVRFRIASLVGSGPAPAVASFTGADCEFDFGSGAVWRTLQGFVKAFCEAIAAMMARIARLVELVSESVVEFLRNLLDRVTTSIEAIIARVTDALRTAVFAIFDRVERALDTILGAVSRVVDSIADTAFNAVSAIGNAVRTALDAIGSAVTFLVGKIQDGFGALLEAATAVITSIRNTVGAIISAIVDTAERVFTSVGSALTTLINTLVGTAEAGLGAVREVIENIPATLRELAGDAASTLTDVVGAPLSAIGELFITQVEDFFGRIIDDLSVSPDKIVREFLTGLGVPASAVEKIAQSANAAMPRTPIWFVAALAVIVPLMLLPAVAASMSPVLEQIRQEVNQAVRPTLLSPGDAIESFFRQTSTDTDLKNELSQAGFTDERITLLLANSRRLLDLGEVFRWWLRDIITEDQLDELIRLHHINDEDAARLKQTVFFIPPVQDLITMAVREVFSPEVRSTFRLDEDFPTDFAAFAHKQGISEEWARNYWAAHWVLPSLRQGFEMLHRRVITADDLDVLMRAQDVMPFWRENLTQIAFAPLTRVDVRRMHGLGLLDEEELVSRYMDLGFAEDNAAMMAQFTVAFNADDPPEVAELEGLTRSTILGMFADGVLSEEQARDIMQVGLGLSEDVVELFLTHQKLVRERADRRALIISVVDLAGGGIINLAEAQDSLARAGLTASEIAGAVKRILDKRERRDRLPTIAQLAKMRRADIIEDDVWRDAMAGHGFPDIWIDRLGDLQATGDVE